MSVILDFLLNILSKVWFSEMSTIILVPIAICQLIAKKITTTVSDKITVKEKFQTAVTIQETELTGLKNFLFNPKNKSLRSSLTLLGKDFLPEWLFIYGKEGVGKSHLAVCVKEEMEKDNMRCCIMNYSTFMNQSKNEETFSNVATENHCLIIDDIEEVLEEDSIGQCLFTKALDELELYNINLILLSKVSADEFQLPTGFFIEDPVELKAPNMKQKKRYVKNCLRKAHLRISRKNVMEIAQMETMGEVKERLNDLLRNR